MHGPRHHGVVAEVGQASTVPVLRIEGSVTRLGLLRLRKPETVVSYAATLRRCQRCVAFQDVELYARPVTARPDSTACHCPAVTRRAEPVAVLKDNPGTGASCCPAASARCRSSPVRKSSPASEGFWTGRGAVYQFRSSYSTSSPIGPTIIRTGRRTGALSVARFATPRSRLRAFRGLTRPPGDTPACKLTASPPRGMDGHALPLQQMRRLG